MYFSEVRSEIRDVGTQTSGSKNLEKILSQSKITVSVWNETSILISIPTSSSFAFNTGASYNVL